MEKPWAAATAAARSWVSKISRPLPANSGADSTAWRMAGAVAPHSTRTLTFLQISRPSS